MVDEWIASDRCPECGAAIKWHPIYILVQRGDAVEVGKYLCLSCGAESDKYERVVENGRESIEPMTNLGLGTPTANPIIGKSKVTLNEILKRIVKEVRESKLDEE